MAASSVVETIFNAIVEMEEIPTSFKHSIIIHVFKGKGSDPLQKENYRGIALTSAIAKLLEFIILTHTQPLLEERVPSYHNADCLQKTQLL